MSNTASKYFSLLATAIWLSLSIPAFAIEPALDLKKIYSRTVDRKLKIPLNEQHYYADLLQYYLHQAGLTNLPAQYILMTDRNPQVQAALLFLLTPDNKIKYIGASPVSTGMDSGYEHFETTLGIFEHTTQNMDFRADGTENQYGLRGYGNKGMRVFDFGWVKARKSWASEMGEMRLQLHSTDPNKLESKLGLAQSKGCIRIPATLNKFLDHYGVLDADYERMASNKKITKLLSPEREPTPWGGKYLVVVDSRRAQRPDWSPQPTMKKSAAKIQKSSASIDSRGS